MLDQPWRALQLAVVLLALAGLAILAWRRRFEALVAGLVLLYMTAIAALLIASPRRELVVLPLLAALAGAARGRGAGIAWRDDGPAESAAPARYGRTTLILLAAILALGFGLRAYRVVEPLATPGDDAHAYYDLSKSLYTEGSYGSPEFRDASDWSPGAPLLYAGSFYATGGAREGTARIVELLLGMAAIVVVFALGRRIACGAGGADRRLRRRRLPALHPLDRRPLQRAAGDLHPARRRPRLPLGRRTGAAAGVARCPGSSSASPR